jgi:ribosomal protein S18 acetylase RimI-like enzyme
MTVREAAASDVAAIWDVARSSWETDYPAILGQEVVDDDEGHVLRLYVDPEHRRRGVGSRLLERACEELFERGTDRVFALVLADNERGNAFYRDHGFEKVDENETTIAGASFRENTFALERD